MRMNEYNLNKKSFALFQILYARVVGVGGVWSFGFFKKGVIRGIDRLNVISLKIFY